MQPHFDRESARQETVTALASAPSKARAALIEEYQQRSREAYSPETWRSYLMIKKLFEEWCVSEGVDPNPPVAPQDVARFVDNMAGRLRSTTIETRLWGIAELHRAAFQPNPCRHELVKLALKSAKRKYGAGPRQAPPLCKREVIAAIHRLGNSRKEIRDKAVLWAATDSWCRASELVALKVEDLLRQDDGTSLLFIGRSKTDPFGNGDYAFLSEAGTKAVLTWIELAGLKSHDPMFTKSQAKARIRAMVPSTITRIVKRCLGRKDVSAHSMRVGGVHDAFRLGCDLSSIMVAGRWRSPEMPARYGRRILASQSAAAQVSAAFSNEEAMNETP